MAELEQVALGTGADTAGSEVLFEGFSKLNRNIDALKSAEPKTGTGPGASEIGFDDTDTAGITATEVQSAIEQINSANGEVNTAVNLGLDPLREGIYESPNIGLTIPLKSLVAGAGISLSSSTTEITITNTGVSASVLNVVYKGVINNDYTIGASDDVIVFDTETTSGRWINLPVGTEGRVVTIKSKLDGSQIYDLTINAQVGEEIEDDNSGQRGSSLSIAPGNTIKVVYSAVTPAAWWII